MNVESAATDLHGELLSTDADAVVTVGVTKDTIVVYLKRGSKPSKVWNTYKGFQVQYMELSAVEPAEDG